MKLELYPYKIVEVDGEKFLYTTNTSGVFTIDEDLIAILELEGEDSNVAFEKLKNRMTYEKFVSIIEDMIEAQFIKGVESKKLPVKENLDKTLCSVTLMLAQKCNLRCTYCYGESGEYGDCGVMNLDIAMKAIDYLAKISKEKKLYVVFFGGEP